MDRFVIDASKNTVLDLDNSQSRAFLITNIQEKQDLNINVKSNANVDLLFEDIKDESTIKINVDKDSQIHVAALCYKPIKSFSFNANLAQNSAIFCHFADFIPGECHGNILINLNGQNSSCDWHLASLSIHDDKKLFDVSVNQKAIGTIAKMDNYGVCRNEGRLTFSGICKIFNGSSSSKAHQNAKIMVFDELSQGIAKPILKIDENDVEASHAAIVGKINDEHIFYLTSRGLNEDEAKKIITLGYLKPIINGFDEPKMKNKIEQLIEGKI